MIARGLLQAGASVVVSSRKKDAVDEGGCPEFRGTSVAAR